MFDTTQLKRYDHTQGPRKVGPDEGYSVELPGVGVRFMAWTEETGGGFSMVEHPIAPGTMAAPWHMHTREDEYSYVITGTLGALLGDEVVTAGPGTWVFKPRNQWHTFWNAGDTPCEIIEIISPAGFEDFFRDLAKVWATGDLSSLGELSERAGLDMDPASVPGLCARFGVTHPLNDA